MVHSYPQKPDLLAFTSAVAMDAGEDVTVTPETPTAELASLPDVLSTTTSTSGQIPTPVNSMTSNNANP